MKKNHRYVLLLGLLLLWTVILPGCGSDKPINYMEFTGGEKTAVDTPEGAVDVVCVYTKYTNASGVPAVPADFLDVEAFQNGEKLNQIFFERDTVGDYRQCNKVVLSTETKDVVWIFRLQDDSSVEVKMDTGNGTDSFVIE